MARVHWLLSVAALVGAFFGSATGAPLAAGDGPVQVLETKTGVRFGIWGNPPSTPAPTLFILASTIEATLGDAYFRQSGTALSRRGYLCVSIDLPGFGEQARAKEPAGLAGWRYRCEHGEDFVAETNARLRQVLDHLIAAGYTDATKVAACGTSRGGFLALHFAAHDARVKCVAAFAPVTDLTLLDEFRGAGAVARVDSLSLARQSDKLAGRAMWIAIGDRDNRVGTDAVIALARRTTAAALAQGLTSRVELRVASEPRGHTTPAGAAAQAAEWIRGQLEAEPPVVRHIGSRRELFVDRLLIDRLDSATLKLHEPVPGGIAVKLDQPWEGPANAGYSVLRHRGRYLLYYRAMTLEQGDDTGVMCVAVSHDGVTWTKPALGLVARAGRRDTNIIADDAGNVLMATPWLDTRPGVPEQELVKALHSEPVSGEKHTAFKDPKGPKRLVLWTSADGFTFRKAAPQPEIVSKLRNCFDGGNTMFWSEAEQAYVLYYRFYDGWRTMARTTSKDFLKWTDSVPMTYGTTPREQFYTNNTEPYFRAPHLYTALAARFMEKRHVINGEQAQAIGLKSARGSFYDNDCSDAVLLTSRAGSAAYDRTFMETFVRPGPGASNWVSRTNYPLTGIFPFGPNQMMLFVSRHYMQDSWHIDRLLLRVDGFASVSAPWTGGEMVTKPLTFAGRELEINYRTSAAGSVRVEIQDAEGKPIPGYALADCPEIIGDEIDRAVRWKSGSDVSRLAGQPVRLRFVLRDADLFALQFRGSE